VLSALGAQLVSAADAAAMRTLLGLVIGTNVQAFDAELAALAGLTSAADKAPHFTGAGTAALHDLTSFGRSLAAATDARSACATLGTWYVLAKSAVPIVHTGTASETTLATIDVPPGAMGANGVLRITTLWSVTNSANTKSCLIKLGATSFLNRGVTTTSTLHHSTLIRNRNAPNSQVSLTQFAGTAGGWGDNGNSVATGSEDTAAAKNVVINGILANAGEAITLESYLVELLHGA
jgi:hypothetical protein